MILSGSCLKKRKPIHSMPGAEFKKTRERATQKISDTARFLKFESLGHI